MPLTLTPDVLDKAMPGTSMATQLANQIRQAIADHDLAPGDFMPGEDDLARASGLSRPTVREALRELELEGLIVRRMGVRTRVAIPPAVRYYDLLRYARTTEALDRNETPRTSFVADFGAEEEDHVLEPCEITKERATAQDVEYLGVKQGASILRRRMVHCLKHTDPETGKVTADPILIHRQALPWGRFSRKQLAHSVSPRGGILTELRQAGVRPTHFVEWWRPRNPNRTEIDLLGLRVTIPVWEGGRIFFVAEDPDTEDLTGVPHEAVQASKMIISCNRMTLHVSGRLGPVPVLTPTPGTPPG